MGLTRSVALSAVYSAIDEINLSLDDDKKLPRSPDTVIFGPSGMVDSVTLVNLVMAAETHLFELTGKEVLLASEDAMSRRKSPYRSASALADYAVEVVVNSGTE
jgi:hypothetical protein